MHTITGKPTDDSIMIRKEVFVSEQGFVEEFDETDNAAKHIVLYINNLPAATCRYFKKANSNQYTIGRVAVLNTFRGQGLGKKVMELAEKAIAEDNGESIILASQTQAQGFYEKCGYTSVGEVFLEEDCPHIHMQKAL
ncbi:GNAT family N-acetyltransferase [Scatolibacter rhodanostii]|uniref:GNAT family N-acetyltransferase n=1 Tax=Scatolibacter rhodanostii TaxID=2014781 RepID=UPI000C07E9A4|nr:GNAT family N-acetyltransferase [Scatolibacter rhodanostii]